MESTVSPSVVARSDGKRELSLTLDQAHLGWLQEMTQKYDLPTVGKALRIVILYARQQEDQEEIFGKVRCTTSGKDKNKVTEVYLLDKEHDSYLDQVVSSYKLADKGKAIRIILDYAISRNDGDTIFGVKRCKHGATCGCAQG